MKKLAALILSLILALGSVAIAEEDPFREWLDTMDDVSVSLLARVLQTEFIRRSGMEDGLDVPAGMYHVGTDFPAGTFTFDMVSNGTEVCVYTDADHYYHEFAFPDFDVILNEYAHSTQIASLYLKYGNILVIEGHVTAKPFVGLQP